MVVCTNTTTVDTISQLPGKLNLYIVEDNDLVFSLNWGIDITDYSFSGNIVLEDGTLEPLGITIINASEGLMNVAVVSEDIAPDTYRWYLDWELDGNIRTVISGSLIIYPK